MIRNPLTLAIATGIYLAAPGGVSGQDGDVATSTLESAAEVAQPTVANPMLTDRVTPVQRRRLLHRTRNAGPDDVRRDAVERRIATARIEQARIKQARIKQARIKAARIKAARIKQARIKAARIRAARAGRGR